MESPFFKEIVAMFIFFKGNIPNSQLIKKSIFP
jgi:hypothetical protein